MKPIVCCDVDGTLIWMEGQGGEPDTPRYDVIWLLEHLRQKAGCEIYLWSGGGIPYAQRWSDKLGLGYKAIAKCSIVPDICVDDEEVTLGKVNFKV